MILKEDGGTIIDALAKEAEKVYIPHGLSKNNKKNMLVIIPDLKLGGTLTVLMEMFQLFIKNGYQLYVISSEDGRYGEKLLDIGAAVVIRPYVACTEQYRHFLQTAFDFVFINSAACYYYIYYFVNTRVQTIWWFHETRTQLETMKESFPHPGLLSENIRIAGVTHAVCRGAEELYGCRIDCLPMAIEDCRNPGESEKSNEKTVFFIPAGYTYIKGQDILLQAISRLPAEYMERSSFVFCGYQLPGQLVYYEKIKKIASLLKNVVFLEELDKKEVYEWYRKCDCVIAPSRVDATPTTIIEAMMFGRLCIVSGAAGISEYMQDCVNGFVFPSENVEELLKRIMLVIADRQQVKGIAEKGRKIYEENFSVSAVYGKLKRMFGELFVK